MSNWWELELGYVWDSEHGKIVRLSFWDTSHGEDMQFNLYPDGIAKQVQDTESGEVLLDVSLPAVLIQLLEKLDSR